MTQRFSARSIESALEVHPEDIREQYQRRLKDLQKGKS